jgi:hypothetical protein
MHPVPTNSMRKHVKEGQCEYQQAVPVVVVGATAGYVRMCPFRGIVRVQVPVVVAVAIVRSCVHRWALDHMTLSFLCLLV